MLINRYKYAAVVPKGRHYLLTNINATIARLKSAGMLKRLDEKWLGSVKRDAAELHRYGRGVERMKYPIQSMRTSG